MDKPQILPGSVRMTISPVSPYELPSESLGRWGTQATACREPTLSYRGSSRSETASDWPKPSIMEMPVAFNWLKTGV